jgi:uracil-DNA glycosylase
MTMDEPPAALLELEREIVGCGRCERLVAWREQVARERRAAFADEHYWGRPLPGFGDGNARVLILGLAPAAHGGNRTGRVFTGDRSGDWLFAALWRTGFANQPQSISRDAGCACATPGSPRPCAALHPPTGRPRSNATPACPGRCAS